MTAAEADPTAGERVRLDVSVPVPGTAEAEDFGDPAEPDAGDLEALELAVNELLLAKGWAATGNDIARAILASDWLAATADRARREALREAAAALRPEDWFNASWLRARADRLETPS